jgi:hypothetical protein
MTTTRRDILAATEVAKNKIIEKLVTKYDVQVACDTIRDEILENMQALRLEDQAALRQANAMRDQMWLKLLTMEKNLEKLHREIQSLRVGSVNTIA